MKITHLIIAVTTVLCLLTSFSATASHQIGGGFTYRYLGDSTIGATKLRKYEVTLVIYQDCLDGQPEAVAQDNPAFLGIFLAASPMQRYLTDTALYFTSSRTLPVQPSTICAVNGSATGACVLKKTFIKVYLLPYSTDDLIISYQRCCRNASIRNIKDPGNVGTTYTCRIPGNVNNNSAIFKDEPPFLRCISAPFNHIHSAVDPDGDSLSYEFTDALEGASDADIKPIPLAPPYQPVSYMAPGSGGTPIPGSPPVAINAGTGAITGVPETGRYAVVVNCNEWRNGVIVNKTAREFVVVVGACSTMSQNFKADAGGDTVIIAGQRIRLRGSGGVTMRWIPGTNLNDSTSQSPIGYFPVPGTYPYVLFATNDSGCTVTDTIVINVLPHSTFAVPTAFSPNGDNRNDLFAPIPVKGSRLVLFSVYNRWGNRVYNGGPSDKGWDGSLNGTMQDMGVYFWRLEYEDSYGEMHSMTGNVTLIR